MHSSQRWAPFLIVEDDPQIRDVLRLTLEDEGMPVETAADGRIALARLRHLRPRAVLLDMSLPYASGVEVAAGLHAAYGDTVPLVMMSADTDAAEAARKAGACAYFQKPFDLEAVISTLHGL